MSFAFGWMLFRLMVWALILVWIDPRTLDWMGGHHVAVWLKSHLWVRLLGVPPLGLLAIISAFEVLDDPQQRTRVEKLARIVGGTVTPPPRMDPTHGLPAGPGLRVPVGRWSMTVAKWKRRSRPTTIARVEVAGVTGFAFAARDRRNEPAFMRGLQQAVVRHAMDELNQRADDAQAMTAAASMDFLASAPISIGHEALDRAVVLRSSRPELARALFTSGAVAFAVEALDAGSRRWSWTLYPSASGDAAEMKLECSRALDDAEALRRVHDLLRAALEHLSQQGLLAA